MSDQNNLEQMNNTQDKHTSRQQERQDRRAQRQADRQAGGLGWMAGLVLIAIGVLYLLHDAGILPTFTNLSHD